MITSRPSSAKRLAVLLHDARRNRQWPVSRCARECGYSPQMWRNLESGHQLPKLKRLPHICEKLNVSMVSLFRCWAMEYLDAPEHSQLRGILSRWGDWPGETDAKGAVGKLVGSLQVVPFDESTGELASRVVAQLVEYRRSLTAASRTHRDLKVVTIPESPDETWWDLFPEKTATYQHPIGWSRLGLGYLSTVVRINPGFGAFHQHVESDCLDAGTEFFSVLQGKATGFMEDPVRPKSWKRFALVPGSVGFYRGGRGHAYLNLGDAPFLVLIVCVPFPPTLLENEAHFPESARGYAEGIEFSLGSIGKSGIPDDLVRQIEFKPTGPSC